MPTFQQPIPLLVSTEFSIIACPLGRSGSSIKKLRLFK